MKWVIHTHHNFFLESSVLQLIWRFPSRVVLFPFTGNLHNSSRDKFIFASCRFQFTSSRIPGSRRFHPHPFQQWHHLYGQLILTHEKASARLALLLVTIQLHFLSGNNFILMPNRLQFTNSSLPGCLSFCRGYIRGFHILSNTDPVGFNPAAHQDVQRPRGTESGALTSFPATTASLWPVGFKSLEPTSMQFCLFVAHVVFSHPF